MADRPTVAPDWATNANHAAGSSAWSGKANKVEPSAGKIAAGFTPDEDFAVEWENWILNLHGQWISFLDGRQANLPYLEGRIVWDHFTGQLPNSGIWKTPTGTVNTVDDSANGGSGACQVDASTGGAHLIETHPLAAVGTGDFRLRSRLRVTGVTASTSSTGLFITSATSNLAFLITGSVSTTEWRILVNSTAVAPSGTVASINSTYADFVIERVDGVVTFSVDGVVMHSQAYADDLNAAKPQIKASGAGIVWADDVELSLLEATTASLTVAPSPHTENGYSAITDGTGNGHEYLDVSWVTPFDAATGANGYRVSAEIYVSSGAAPYWWIENKTTTGFRLMFSGPFDGEVHWEAK